MSALVGRMAACLLALAFTACGGAARPAAAPDDRVGVRGAPCASTSSCDKGEVCTTEDGVCNPAPGCGPGKVCPAVCYGTCRPASG